jgi:hypothetical protein
VGRLKDADASSCTSIPPTFSTALYRRTSSAGPSRRRVLVMMILRRHSFCLSDAGLDLVWSVVGFLQHVSLWVDHRVVRGSCMHVTCRIKSACF